MDNALYRKVGWRLIPFMMLLYLVAFLDRVNVGFAALTMNADLGLTPVAYGWGAGIFFLGYFFFEVPSNLILERVGARLWIARIAVTWGLVSAATAMVQGPVEFFVLRFLLGVAEAGFLPGMILYLTYWFPPARLARYVSLFMMAVPLASAVGSPLSGLILDLADGALGFRGWQWLFVIEGLPSCLLGLLTLVVLPDRPSQARWLTADERATLEARLAEAAAANRCRTHEALWPALADRRVLLLGLVYFGVVIGLYGVGLWLPQLVREAGFSIAQVGMIVALPYVASCLVMPLWGRHSDARHERVWHVALPIIVTSASLLAAGYLHGTPAALLALGIATVGIYATLGPFWGLPPMFLAGTGAAGGVALINSIGNLGGFLGPWIVGWTRQVTHSFEAGFTLLAVCLAVAALITLRVGWEIRAAARVHRPAAKV